MALRRRRRHRPPRPRRRRRLPPLFKIFFPWDQYKLTPEAKRTVDEIASQYKDKQIERINIEGNTDTSGSSDYNMGLGAKRSDARQGRADCSGHSVQRHLDRIPG